MSHELPVSLVRTTHNSISEAALRGMLGYLKSRALAGDLGGRNGWHVKSESIQKQKTDNGYIWIANFVFERAEGRDKEIVQKQIAKILDNLEKAGTNSRRFKSMPFVISDNPQEEIVEELPAATPAPKVIAAHELPDLTAFLEMEDDTIENHPAFKDQAYGRASQLRMILSAIESFRRSAVFRQSNPGRRLSRANVLLYGESAGGKTEALKGITRLLGEGAVFHLDAPNVTKAGFQEQLLSTGKHPAIGIVEEMEKVSDPRGFLTTFGSLLDTRASTSKLTYFRNEEAEVPMLWIAAINNKSYFDNLMRSSPTEAGFLSSRFPVQIYFPRPNVEEMKLILERDIKELGGNLLWVEICLRMMEEFNTNDPRRITGWLIGRERLEDGAFQQDMREMLRREREDRRASFERRTKSFDEVPAEERF